MSVLLMARGLSKRFGAVVAVADLDLDLRSGEVHALIGPNGAGKSTVIALLSGELRADSGRVFLDGRDVSPLPPHRRARLGLGRTFQISSVLPSFSVLENVAVAVQARARGGLRLLRTAATDPELNEAALRVLERLSLVELAERPAASLAHGERRLLELAIALAQEPKVLLLDEPLAGVGPDVVDRLLRVFEAVKRSTALLLVEHDMDAVFRIADRVTVLVYGSCIASGPPELVRSDRAVRSAYLGDL